MTGIGFLRMPSRGSVGSFPSIVNSHQQSACGPLRTHSYQGDLNTSEKLLQILAGYARKKLPKD